MSEPIPDEVASAMATSEPEPRSEAWNATAPEPSDDQTLSLAEVKKLRRESQSLRTRLRESEERLGAAAARENARDKAEAERIAGELLVDPEDLWRSQADVQAFYDDEFSQIVPDKVRDAAAAIVAAKPHLARPQNAPPPTDRPIEGLRPGASPQPEQEKVPTWSSALHGR